MDMHAVDIITSPFGGRTNSCKLPKVKSCNSELITESRLLSIKDNPGCSASRVYGFPDFLFSSNRTTKDSTTSSLGIN